MRLFQNYGIAPSYRPRLTQLITGAGSFSEQVAAFLEDRYGAAHLLKPVLDKDPNTFFTLGDTPSLQYQWARENGMAESTSLTDILRSQVEHHRADVFYNLDPVRYDDDFIARLPGCVKTVLGWRAAPGHNRFKKYDLILSNFPSIRATYEAQGIRTAAFFPSHDPVLDTYAARKDRDIDVLFYGGFSRHHQKRAELLNAVAKLSPQFNVVFCLDNSRYTSWAETPLGWVPPLSKVRRPKAIRKVARPPVFGRDVYERLSRAKIVFNAAIDMAGEDRGNMRCFETLGAGTMLLTDKGQYPRGMEDGQTLVNYETGAEACQKIETYLSQERWKQIAQKGHDMIRTDYSDISQFNMFCRLL